MKGTATHHLKKQIRTLPALSYISEHCNGWEALPFGASKNSADDLALNQATEKRECLAGCAAKTAALSENERSQAHFNALISHDSFRGDWLALR
jgi:hypothetical protein